ncbi:S8 family serine peptidase [Arthrobacter sp. D1-29]
MSSAMVTAAGLPALAVSPAPDPAPPSAEASSEAVTEAAAGADRGHEAGAGDTEESADGGQYLVTYAPGTDVAAEAKSLRAKNIGVGRTFSHALRGAVVKANPAQAAALARSPRVLSVEADTPVSIDEVQQPATWGLDRTDQRTLPLSNSYSYSSAGSGVAVYVVDTGVLAAHADFGGRVAAGWTALNDGLNSGDCNGHGTHVAGTAAGKTYGVAKAATIIPVRALYCDGSGLSSDIIAGLDWVAAHHQPGWPAVVNLSIGGFSNYTMDAAVMGVINDGITVVTAAGNTATNACERSPARVPAALTIAATDISDRQASFSNYGNCVDLYAPGVSIISAGHTSTTAIKSLSGTSMSVPHAAGAAAVLLAASPGLSPAEVNAKIIDNATTGVVVSATPGTPNRLLYVNPATGNADSEPSPAPTPDLTRAALHSAADTVAAGPDGVLWNYPANGSGGFRPREAIGGGWQGLDTGFVTDWNRDGVFDLIAQWTDGRLTYYPGLQTGGFSSPKTIGSGWGGYEVTIGHWSSTNPYPGIVAYDPAGTLWHYPNNASGTLTGRSMIGSGWGGLYITMADFDRDAKQDLLSKRRDGSLILYRGSLQLADPLLIGTGWNVIDAITEVEGFQGKGSYGLTARMTDGRLAYYPINNGTWGTPTIVGSGWNGYSIFR